MSEPSTYAELIAATPGWPLERAGRTLGEIQAGAPVPGVAVPPGGLRWASRNEPPPQMPAPAEEHGTVTEQLPTAEDQRERRILALEADVANLRCSLARLETIVTNFQRGDIDARI